MTNEERFWRLVEKSEDCWEWRGYTTPITAPGAGGYGRFNRYLGTYMRRTVMAHRFSYELAYGPIPEGLHVCHRCDNRVCVRPDHLFLGTALDNTRDRDRKGRHRALRGEEHPRCRLTRAQAETVRRRYAAGGASYAALAAELGVSVQVIVSIVKNLTHPDPAYSPPPTKPYANAKLTSEQVAEIRIRYERERITHAALAAEYGVGTSAVQRAVRQTTWI